MDPSELAKNLRNIGPTLSKKLCAVGVDSPEKLHEMGAEKVYLLLLSNGLAGDCINAVYLYVLHGAILDCNWNDIPESLKEACKEFTKELRGA